MSLQKVIQSIANFQLIQNFLWASFTIIQINKDEVSLHTIVLPVILLLNLALFTFIIKSNEQYIHIINLSLIFFMTILLIGPFSSEMVQIIHAFLLGQTIYKVKQQKFPILLFSILFSIVLNIHYQFEDDISIEGFIGLQFILISFTIETIILQKNNLQPAITDKSQSKNGSFRILNGIINNPQPKESAFVKIKQEENNRKQYIKQLNNNIENNQNESQSQIYEINQNSSYKLNYNDESKQQEQHNLFAHLVNSFPDGMAILALNNEILYINKRLKQLFTNSFNEKEVIQKLLRARNCAEKIKEENQFKLLFEKLNEKYLNNDSKQKLSFRDKLIGTIENVSVFQYVKDDSETVGDECQKQFAQLIEEIDASNKHFQFLEEKAMLCYTEDELSLSEENSSNSSSDIQFLTVLEVFFKPYLRENKPNLMLIVRDVSYFNQLKAMKTINHNKSKMLSQVSHEFRTPLNCITLMVQSLMLELDQQKNEEYCEPILSSANQLLCLVNDILDVAQLKVGKFTLNYSNFDLLLMIKGIQNLMKIQFKNKGIEFLIGANTKQTIVNSDENRVRQILLNLIGNAIKFTHRGSIKVSFQRLVSEVVEVIVQDTGIGISLEDQMLLFEAFGKLEKSASQNLQGVGLGLMISNILAQKIGSPASGQFNEDITKIQVYSEGENRGSRFRFLIYDQNYQINDTEKLIEDLRSFSSTKAPACSRLQDIVLEIPQVNQQQDSLRQFTLESVGIKKPNLWFSNCTCKEILLVDDNCYNILALKTLLQKQNLKIDEANDGFECLKKLANFENDNWSCENPERCSNYRIVLMDIEMPKMDGIETTKKIREKFSKDIIIFGLSGYSDQKEKEKCLSIGMNGYFTKPLKISDFIETIRKI